MSGSLFRIGAGILATLAVAAQPVLEKVPIAQTWAGSGLEMFEAYCASCHGMDGKGSGPAAAALKVAPTDLTALAKQNNGEFPAAHVVYVLGSSPGSTRAHGTSEMPVWGELFRALGGVNVTQIRIYNLMRYLESIQDPPLAVKQRKAKQPKAPRPMFINEVTVGSGSAMFVAYCSSCHGIDGAGGGPTSSLLKHKVPDLTLLAKNNAGKFPEENVRTILGWQRGEAAHGSSEMPVWGDLFRSAREQETIVLLRLRNILRYVESIQR